MPWWRLKWVNRWHAGWRSRNSLLVSLLIYRVSTSSSSSLSYGENCLFRSFFSSISPEDSDWLAIYVCTSVSRILSRISSFPMSSRLPWSPCASAGCSFSPRSKSSTSLGGVSCGSLCEAIINFFISRFLPRRSLIIFRRGWLQVTFRQGISYYKDLFYSSLLALGVSLRWYNIIDRISSGCACKGHLIYWTEILLDGNYTSASTFGDL